MLISNLNKIKAAISDILEGDYFDLESKNQINKLLNILKDIQNIDLT